MSEGSSRVRDATASGCHGGVKGRGGFKLSSGVLHPKDDYEWIVKGGTYQVLTAEVAGSRVPRINLKDPQNSLILLKATGSMPHGGGQRFKKTSKEYESLLKWIKDGAPYGPENDRENRVVRLEVFPPIVTLERGAKQRLLVTAHFSGWPHRRLLSPGSLHFKRQRNRHGQRIRLHHVRAVGRNSHSGPRSRQRCHSYGRRYRRLRAELPGRNAIQLHRRVRNGQTPKVPNCPFRAFERQ